VPDRFEPTNASTARTTSSLCGAFDFVQASLAEIRLQSKRLRPYSAGHEQHARRQ